MKTSRLSIRLECTSMQLGCSPQDCNTSSKVTVINKGFTIIELLVVLAIITLLSTAVFAALSSARAKARDANRVATAKSLKTALTLYEDKYGTVIGINGLSASGGGAPMMVASGTKSIIDVLVDEGLLSRKVAGDSVFGNTGYYLGVNTEGRYDVFAKLERPENAMSSSTLSTAVDGADALTAGFNYASGFGGGVGGLGGGAVASGGGGNPLTTATGTIAFGNATNTLWVAPAGVYSVSAVVVGGGGGGGGAYGRGGGGGGLGYKNNIPVTPGQSYVVMVGGGGAGGPSGTGVGGNGVNTYFIDTSTVVGNGGVGGESNNSNSGIRGIGGSFLGEGGGPGSSSASGQNTGGGGAGGYNGAIGGGGAGGSGDGGALNGGAGGGGGTCTLGAGASGSIGTAGTAAGGGRGSSNSQGNCGFGASAYGLGTTGGSGGACGGGGGGGGYNQTGPGGAGGSGCLRLIWGPGVSYPSNMP